jgi:hypothetical protein
MAVRIVAIQSGDVAVDNGDIFFKVIGSDNKPYTLRFARGISSNLSTMIAILLRQTTNRFGQEPHHQSLVLTGVAPYVNEDGKSGLELQIEGFLRLGLLIPPVAIPKLQTVLKKLAAPKIRPRKKARVH